MTKWSLLTGVLSAVLVVSVGSTPAYAASDAPLPPLAAPVWLCKPGMSNNPCGQDLHGGALTGPFAMRYPQSHQAEPLDATVVAADNTTSHQAFTVPAQAPIDCFYVYPTVDILNNPVLPVGSIPPIPQDNEMAAVLMQAGRLTSTCRVFTPIYRQVSLVQALLTGLITGGPASAATGTEDVEQAFNDYWQHDNLDPVTHQRRGVVLLAHSQGNGGIAAILQHTFDTSATNRKLLVGAYLIGSNLQVPDGQLDGGGDDPNSTLQHVPVCVRTSAAAPVPTGCVVAYSSFDQPAGRHPAKTDVFGRNFSLGHHNVCVNPAALLAGAPATAAMRLSSYFGTRQLLQGDPVAPAGHLAPLYPGSAVTSYGTGFASYPGQLSGQCQSVDDADGNATWLQVSGRTSLFPDNDRTSLIGLHVFDYNLALGDVVALVAAQSAVWNTAH